MGSRASSGATAPGGVLTTPSDEQTLDERTLEDVSLPDAVEGFTKRRVELVQRAVKEWTAALIDLGGRNNLLRYRDLKVGTLDLTNASPKAVAALLSNSQAEDCVSAISPSKGEAMTSQPLGTLGKSGTDQVKRSLERRAR